MNSTIESGGADVTTKSPNYANQLGMDLDVFANPGALANDQTSASLDFTSTSEYFMPSAFFLVSDEGPATISSGERPPAWAVPRTTARRSAPTPATGTAPGRSTYTYQWQRCDAAGNSCARHPRRHQQHLHADRRRRRGHRPRRRHRHQRRRLHVGDLSAPTAIAVPHGAGQHRAARRSPDRRRRASALSADPGNWSGTGPVTHTYQWERCDANGANCQDVAGATGQQRTPRPPRMSAAPSAWWSPPRTPSARPFRTSAPVTVAALVPPVSIAPPALGGPGRAGPAAHRDPGIWEGTGPRYSYAWQRCDAHGSATASTSRVPPTPPTSRAPTTSATPCAQWSSRPTTRASSHDDDPAERARHGGLGSQRPQRCPGHACSARRAASSSSAAPSTAAWHSPASGPSGCAPTRAVPRCAPLRCA